MPDVRRRLHGRAAQVDRRSAGLDSGTKSTHRPGGGVVQAQAHPARVRVRPAPSGPPQRRRRARPRPARSRRRRPPHRDRSGPARRSWSPTDRHRGAARRRQRRLGLGPPRPDPRHRCRPPAPRRCRSRSRRPAPAGPPRRAGRRRTPRPTPGGRCRHRRPGRRARRRTAARRSRRARRRRRRSARRSRPARPGRCSPASAIGRPASSGCTSTPTPTRGTTGVGHRAPARRSRPPRPAAGRAGGVTLNASSDPSTTTTGPPTASTSAASSVACRCSAAARRCAASSTDLANPCGVCTASSSPRSTAAPVASSRTVSAPAGRARRAPASRAPRRPPLDQVDGSERPRGVVHQHDVDLGGQRGQRRRDGLLPGVPAGDHAQRRAGEQLERAPRASCRRPRAVRRRRPRRRTGPPAGSRTAWASSGSPRTGRSALATPAPSRSPRPAAGTSTPTVMPPPGRQGRRFRPGCPRSTGASKHHPAVRRGQDAGDLHARLLADAVAGPLDDDHRAVVEVADRLAGLLAGLGQQHGDLVAGDDRRAQREGEGVQVHDPDAGQRRAAGQVGVQGEQADPRSRHIRTSLASTSGTPGASSSMTDTVDPGLTAQRLEHLEAAAAPTAAQLVAGVGQPLQLARAREPARASRRRGTRRAPRR